MNIPKIQSQKSVLDVSSLSNSAMLYLSIHSLDSIVTRKVIYMFTLCHAESYTVVVRTNIKSIQANYLIIIIVFVNFLETKNNALFVFRGFF